MTATKATKTIKDGAGASFTGAVAAESIGADIAPFTYLGSPSSEALIEPATATKQPALGTAGTPSADVLSVQGVASMTPLQVDGSAVTNPISAVSLPLPDGAATSSNQTSQITQETAAATALGAPADAAWVSGAGSAIALLKTIAGDGGAVSQSGTWTVQPGNTANTTAWKIDGSAVTQPVSGTVTANAGTNLNTSALATSAQIGEVQASPTSNTILDRLKQILTGIVLAAGSAVIGKVGIDQTTPGTTNAVLPIAGATGGATPYKLLSAATTNATSVKASAGTIYKIIAINTTGTIYYLKLYNKASAPTVGTDTPVLVFPVPASTSGNGFVISGSPGIAFPTGIAFALTGAIADADTTSAAVGVAINITYV